ncbi:MAG: rod shape-determining protein MreC [Lentimicrobiaceae bacterium]|nr:rod shape-determining protein MreC [Lentimicrobiaceae bacterium]
MRSLYLFLSRTMHVFLFFALAGVCVYCMYKSSDYKQWAVNSISKEITGPVLKLQTKYTNWLYLQTENDRLQEQNRNLLTLAFNHKRDNDTIETVYHGDSLLFSYYSAKVVEGTVNKRNNYITLDKGYNDGIRTEMGVISSEGVVGIIKTVSPNFSVALLVLNSQFSIFAKLKNNDVSGTLTWDGTDIQYAQINNLANIENIKVLDTIVTEHSLIFPPDYPIGIVSSISPKAEGGFFVLKVRLLVPFHKLRNVYIIEQNYSEELNNLMERAYGNE